MAIEERRMGTWTPAQMVMLKEIARKLDDKMALADADVIAKAVVEAGIRQLLTPGGELDKRYVTNVELEPLNKAITNLTQTVGELRNILKAAGLNGDGAGGIALHKWIDTRRRHDDLSNKLVVFAKTTLGKAVAAAVAAMAAAGAVHYAQVLIGALTHHP